MICYMYNICYKYKFKKNLNKRGLGEMENNVFLNSKFIEKFYFNKM